MYQDKFNDYENIENLAGKAWGHAIAIDLLNKTDIKDCSIHCFHYQQMIELFFKHLLETKSKFGAFSKSYKLRKLLEELIYSTSFKTDKSYYFMALHTVTICAEEYRYNFLIDCQGYKEAVKICDKLIEELLIYEKEDIN